MKKKFGAKVLSMLALLALWPAASLALDSFMPPITGPALGSDHPLTAGVYYLLDGNGIPTENGASASHYNVYYDGTTVTLQDATMTTPLYIPGGTTIQFLGKNTMGTADDDNNVTTAIQTMTAGDLTITGTGSYTAYSLSGDGIIAPEANGDIRIKGGTLDLTNIKTSVNARNGSVYIEGNAKVLAQTITTGNNIELSGNSSVEAVKIAADQKIVMGGNSKVDVNGGGISSKKGIEVKENAEVSTAAPSGALNTWDGPITINSTKKLKSTITMQGKAAISAGLQQNTEASDVIIKSEVEVSGFVGIGCNGAASKIVIDGGKIDVNAAFIGIYTQSTGVIEIKNDANVHVVGAGNAAPGIATFSQTPQPIYVENSTVEIEKCGYGFSGSSIELKDSAITVSSTTRAFLTTPTLNYTYDIGILAGETAQSAKNISEADANADTFKNKYVKVYQSPKARIDFDLSGGTGADGESYTFDNVMFGGVFKLPKAPTRPGYTFVGWTDGNKVYQPGDTITVEKNMKLTAIWEKLPSAADLPKTGDESPVLLWGAALAAAAAAGFMLKRKK